MKKAILEEDIEIPSGINAVVEGDEIIMAKDNVAIRKKINSMVEVKIDGNKIKLSCGRATKREKKIFGSLKAHIKNMTEGLGNKWTYKLQIATVHFPVTASIDKDSNEFVLKNFLGEKKDRRMKLTPGVDVKINKDVIELSSADVEKAGQTAADLEKLTKVRNRDRRIFQDGIFIIEKPGRNFI
jgi:large subunit ribosomal protein L6